MNNLKEGFMEVLVDGSTQLRRYSVDVTVEPHCYVPDTGYTEELMWLVDGSCHIITNFRPDDLDLGMEQHYDGGW